MERLRALEYQLEKLVDSYDIVDVLSALREICSEKADHVRSAWQDEALAKAWEKTGVTLDKCVVRVPSVVSKR